MNYTDVMLDLETMGNKSNTAIVSIGAVEFNINTGETGRLFYKVVDLQSCLDIGLKVQASTIYWWLQQSEAARKRICGKGEHIQNVLVEFNQWMLIILPMCRFGEMVLVLILEFLKMHMVHVS